MSKKNIYSLFLLTTFIAFLPLAIYAAPTLATVLTNFKNALNAIGATLATIAFIVAGLMFLLAVADPSKLNAAKMALFAAIVGVAIIALANFADPFVRNLFGL